MNSRSLAPARLFIVAACSAALSGCANWWAVHEFRPSPLGGHTAGKLELTVIPPMPGQVEGSGRADEVDALKMITRHCLPKPPESGATLQGGALPILFGALAESAIQVWIDGQIRRVEAIASAATASTGLTLAVDAEVLEQARCLVVTRRSPTGEGLPEALPDLTLIMRLEHTALPLADSSALRFQPIYVRLRRSAAVPRDEAQPKMRVSVALVLRAFAQHRDGLPRLAAIGESVTQVASVALGPSGAAQCIDQACPISDLLPLPLKRGPISVSIAIAEQGRTGLDVRAVSSDLKALREAIGPAIGDSVKEALD